MDTLDHYTEAEHDRALNRLAADLDLVAMEAPSLLPCPICRTLTGDTWDGLCGRCYGEVNDD